MIKNTSFWLKLTITILSLAFIFWYFTSQVDWVQLQQTNYQIRWDMFWFGTLLAILSNLLDGLAWHRILLYLNRKIKLLDALVAQMVGFTLGILIPIAGTVELGTKIVILKKKYTVLSSEEIISSIAAIRTVFLVTAYMVWGFLILSLNLEGYLTTEETIFILLLVWSGLTILILALIILFTNIDKFLPIRPNNSTSISDLGFFTKFIYNVKHWLRGFAENFQYILKMSRKEKIFMFIAVFSQNIIKWVSVYYIFLAVVDLPFFVVMVSSVLGGFVNLIPAAIPGLLGLREIAAQWSIDIFINDSILSLVAAAIQSLGLWIFFIISGVVGVLYYVFSFRGVSTSIPEETVIESNQPIINK